MGVWRWAVGLLLLGCVRQPEPAAVPLHIELYRFTPFPVYEKWRVEVWACGASIVMLDGGNTMNLDSVPASIDSTVWMAAPTERPDGRFWWNKELRAGVALERGGTRTQDTIVLSGQGLWVERLVKHELLHLRVHSSTELRVGAHGPPWGLCENI